MILSYPTGYFADVLPEDPSQAGNVTYTCSSAHPPRSNRFLNQITAGIESSRRLPPKTIPQPTRRAAVGELVYTITKSNQPLAATGKFQYEPGQIIELATNLQSNLLVQPVQPVTTVQHNTNLLDLASLGLSQDEIQLTSVVAPNALDAASQQLNSLRTQYTTLTIQISDNQKAANEAQKALDALNTVAIVLPGSGTETLQQKLQAKVADLQTQKTALVAAANALVDQIDTAYSNVLQLMQLVR